MVVIINIFILTAHCYSYSSANPSLRITTINGRMSVMCTIIIRELFFLRFLPRINQLFSNKVHISCENTNNITYTHRSRTI